MSVRLTSHRRDDSYEGCHNQRFVTITGLRKRSEPNEYYFHGR